MRMEKRDILIVGDDRAFSEIPNGKWQIFGMEQGRYMGYRPYSVIRSTCVGFGPETLDWSRPSIARWRFGSQYSVRIHPRYRTGTFIKISTGRNALYREAMPWFSADLLTKMEREEAEWSRRVGLRRNQLLDAPWLRLRIGGIDIGNSSRSCLRQPDGVREPTTGPGAVKLCVSQPKVWAQIYEEWASEDETTQQVSISENDGSGGYCTCDVCRAWDEGAETTDFLQRPTVSLSDRYVRFANAVADTFRESGHEVPLAAYAYQIYSDAPVEATLDPSVRLRFVPGEYPSDASMRADLRAQWDGWREHGAPTMYWR